jgi:hypothetical protein
LVLGLPTGNFLAGPRTTLLRLPVENRTTFSAQLEPPVLPSTPVLQVFVCLDDNQLAIGQRILMSVDGTIIAPDPNNGVSGSSSAEEWLQAIEIHHLCQEATQGPCSSTMEGRGCSQVSLPRRTGRRTDQSAASLAVPGT